MRIGIIGVGTVGSGVVEIIESMQAEWRTQGVDATLAMICAKNEEELTPYRAKGYPVTTDANTLLHHPEIDVLVELAGGYELPRKWITLALENGKHVVTANKALLAKYGHEIFPLASKKGRHVLFEAAVGGGIPIIRSIQESFTGNRIESLSCIINGTCNYILTQMSQFGLSFSEALQQAQANGFAEADPSFDIEGIDAAHKTALLASLASGKRVDFQRIHITGITNITAQDIQYAKEFDCCIKLLGNFRRMGTRVDARVHPCLVHTGHLLSSVNGVLNAVYLECDNLGPTLQTGAGAGKLPTASAVAADLVFLARSEGRSPLPMEWFCEQNNAELMPIGELETRYYFRFTTKDSCGVLASITSILSKNAISIESILQKGVRDPGKVDVVVVTEKTRESAVKSALTAIDALDAVTEPSRMIRFL
ncbi:MAG TPA: homoserine dehydrogenase [Fibrobacteraceae bacterium]|nr:homoserine dehydrogenase [Fibrobacteraceae bacterium]